MFGKTDEWCITEEDLPTYVLWFADVFLFREKIRIRRIEKNDRTC